MAFYIEKKVNGTEKTSARWRTIFVWLMISSVLGFLLINLIDLQLVNGEENLIRARNISQVEEIERAPRGIIFDTNGKILAKNVPAYTLYIKTSEFGEENADNVFEKLSGILGVKASELKDTYEVNLYTDSEKKNKQPKVTLSRNINYDQYLSILVKSNELKGVYTTEEPRREYVYGSSVSHVLGYVSDISEKEAREAGLDSNSKIGKEGLEKSYDKELRGVDGKRLATVNTLSAQSQQVISQTPVVGNNLYLTIDIEWQKKLETLLAKRVKESKAVGGVVIIMETDTGNVKAMVNYPSYDNNLFAKGISGQDFKKLNTDEFTPLVNRAVALQLPTGSTFKPMVAAAALQEGVITPQTEYKSGCVELPQYKLCEADNKYLGTMTVVEGIGRSSNVFFCKTALAMTEKAKGIRTLIKYTDQFGIGKKTGINLPGEQAGTMASPELKIERQHEQWYLADICNTVIGQGLVTATPIQMVTVASALGNNGKVYKPNLVAKIENQDGKVIYESKPELVQTVDVSKSNFETIRKGMNYAVEGSKGSAWLLKNSPGDPYAKTGSADASEYRNGKKIDGAHSWAIGGFEYKGKNYSFVVHLQEGGRGYQSVPVVRDFLDWIY